MLAVLHFLPDIDQAAESSLPSARPWRQEATW
jgi:hypothetical protein